MKTTKAIWLVSGVGLLTILAFITIGIAVRADGGLAILAALVALVWAAAMACAYAMLYDWRGGRYILSAIAAASVVVAGLFSLSALVGGVLLFGFITSAAQLIASATRDRLTWRLRPVLLPGLRVLIAGLAVAVAALVLPMVRSYVSEGGAAVPAESIGVLLRPAAPIISNLLPGYTPTSTVDNLIDFQIGEQARSLPAGFAIAAGQREIVRREVSRSVGIELTGQETVSDIVAEYINRYVRDLSEQNGVLVVIVLAVIALLAIRAIVPFIAWLALGVAVVLFWLARKSGLVTIVPTQLPVERLHL